MKHPPISNELGWTLISRVHHEEAALLKAEAVLTVAEARLSTVEAGIFGIRAFLSKLGVETSEPHRSSSSDPYMTPKEFGKLMKKTARYVRSRLATEGQLGVHYHKEGKSYSVHVAEAEQLFRGAGNEKAPSHSGNRSEQAQAVLVDEVTRYRAKAALKKARAS